MSYRIHFSVSLQIYVGKIHRGSEVGAGIRIPIRAGTKTIWSRKHENKISKKI